MGPSNIASKNTDSRSTNQAWASRTGYTQRLLDDFPPIDTHTQSMQQRRCLRRRRMHTDSDNLGAHTVHALDALGF
jgi:hypothetical protein